MTLDELQHSLAKITGKAAIWVENTVMATLTDGSQIYLEYLEESDELFFFGHVASIPEERIGSYALFLLEANLFGKDTGGTAVLAYDREECRVVIWDRANLSSLTDHEFRERFTYLYLAKLHWANKMREDVQTPVPPGIKKRLAAGLGRG